MWKTPFKLNSGVKIAKISPHLTDPLLCHLYPRELSLPSRVSCYQEGVSQIAGIHKTAETYV